MKRVLFCLMVMMGVLTLSAQSDEIRQSQSVYDFTVKDDAGKDVSLAEYKGKVLLIVNTATRCGFTPQYIWTSLAISSESGLLALFRRYTLSARPTSTSSSHSSIRLR